ncbi:hypothetical protein [Leifsonia naganoensis]|uniref:Secreted protein n=1 Tax=Leifsonia naganoensis TaxID=150025 RepID=A0A853DLK7_9MICO|nr:hypothetical protein [Leifsonia naganoensis]NYK09956.1 hypothetical protein [Leifsonia naganoensis]
MRFRNLLITLLAAGSLVIGAAIPATAAEPDNQFEEELGLYTVVNDRPVRVTDSFLEEHALELNEAAPEQEPSTRLIDWNQWFGCYSLNNANDVFANYMFWWDGAGKNVRLKCGEGDARSGWGYKHIRDGKESQWQTKLDAARAAGWNSSAVKVESWDDLMSGASAAVILYPDYIRRDTVSNKWCANNLFYLQDANGNVRYKFQVEVAWASDSDRLITSFPSNRAYC